jgi:hypothetical protein
MSDKRCKTCEEWHCGKDYLTGGKYVAGSCKSEKFVYTGESERVPIDGLGYCDGELHSASFETGPEFGCIHWKGRKE